MNKLSQNNVDIGEIHSKTKESFAKLYLNKITIMVLESVENNL